MPFKFHTFLLDDDNDLNKARPGSPPAFFSLPSPVSPRICGNCLPGLAAIAAATAQPSSTPDSRPRELLPEQQVRTEAAAEVKDQISMNLEALDCYFKDKVKCTLDNSVDEIIWQLKNFGSACPRELVKLSEAEIRHLYAIYREELRLVLFRNSAPLDADPVLPYSSIHGVSLSGASHNGEISEELESFGEIGKGSLGNGVSMDSMNPDAVAELREKCGERMTLSGHEKERCQAYFSVRREALDEGLAVLGVEKLSGEEVQKIEWKDLDEKMKKWVRASKITVKVLLPCEKRLCDKIFTGSNQIKDIYFREAARYCIMQLLSFVKAVIGVRPLEKLFSMLDMYEALEDVLPDLRAIITDDLVLQEAEGALYMLGEAARSSYAEFENTVKSETSREPKQCGEIHPLVHYVMSYLKLLALYGETLNSLLECSEDEPNGSGGDGGEFQELESMSPLARNLLYVVSCLETNLEEKSKFYKDGVMQHIFLMNNILYIVQEVKDSELRSCLGDIWVRKHHALVQQYATSYLRASWFKALSCLKDEGLGFSTDNNTLTVALKIRFKNFNACFEEIYRVQTAWKVPDEQLRDELRMFISERVTPAYRSFLGRYRRWLESGRDARKYIKYTPEDLENYVLDLFEGVPGVMHRLRRKNS